MDTTAINNRITEIETAMAEVDFWNDKTQAQAMIRELKDLQDKKEGVNAFDRGNAILSIYSGAGGDDAEDFTRMLYEMYTKFCDSHNLSYTILSETPNTQNGYRNISIEISGKNAYGTLKHESGVHRLVRLSPFNAKSLRQTSFSMVEVIPVLSKSDLPEVSDGDIQFDFAKSGGPGGQNVNKRETAVRATHVPSGLSVHVTSERSQEQNKQRAIEMLKGKLYARAEAEHKTLEESLKISKKVENEWGNQIRSYVLHPYKMVKDHRTGVETSNPDLVLSGDLDAFIEAEKKLY